MSGGFQADCSNTCLKITRVLETWLAGTLQFVIINLPPHLNTTRHLVIETNITIFPQNFGKMGLQLISNRTVHNFEAVPGEVSGTQ